MATKCTCTAGPFVMHHYASRQQTIILFQVDPPRIFNRCNDLCPFLMLIEEAIT